MSLRSRIVAALAANAFGQAVTVGSQILLTPLYFRYWGAALYGEWLMLASIPAYLTVADLGIGSAAANEMTMRAAVGDRAGAQRTMLGALWVSAGAAGLVMVVGLVVAAMAWHWQIPHTPGLAPTQAALILTGLALTVALNFPAGVASAGFRACERNAQSILWPNVARLVDALTVGVLLLNHQPPTVICLGMVGVRAVALVAQWVMLWRVCPWLFDPKVRADRTIARRLFAPALGFIALPLGNALALQGPVLVIGAVFGGPAVAMFSALRTLARIPMQLTNMLNSSVWPELSRAYGAGDLALLRHLHRGAWGLSAWLVLLVALVLGLLGPWIAQKWLGAAAPFDALVFGMLLLLTVLSSLWNCSAVVLMATNSHLRLGSIFIAVHAVSIASAALLIQPLGWVGLLVCLAAAEAFLLGWVMPAALRLTADRFGDFIKNAVLGFPLRFRSR